jgi:hypothetical protein
MITTAKVVNVVIKLSLIASWTIAVESELIKPKGVPYAKSATMGNARYVMTTLNNKNTISNLAAFLSRVDFAFLASKDSLEIVDFISLDLVRI